MVGLVRRKSIENNSVAWTEDPRFRVIPRYKSDKSRIIMIISGRFLIRCNPPFLGHSDLNWLL